MVWEVIGKLFAVYILAKVLLSIWKKLRAFFFPLLGWRINYKSYGQWAVVTGATDGIGKSYAFELAKLGMKVVLISRTQERLDQIAKEIDEKHKVETKTIAFDFGARTDYERIENELSSLDIGVLVNNVGMGYEYPEYFEEVAIETFEKMINVNMLSLVKMTHIVLRGMLERKKGVMIHVSSASANLPVPLLTVYSASKAFVDFFARAIQWEYRDKGIISQSLTPFFVATKLAGVRPGLFSPTPNQFVKQALGTVGIMDRSTGYIMHDLQSMFYSCLPAVILEKSTLAMMAGVHKRALKKRAKKDTMNPEDSLQGAVAQIARSEMVCMSTDTNNDGVKLRKSRQFICSMPLTLPFCVLVNNAGMVFGHPEYFNMMPIGKIEDMINANILSAVKMTYMVLKGMLERKKGILIHVSSSGADQPIPFITVYSAAKVFVDYLARALQIEYRSSGIISQSLVPFYMTTKLSGVQANLLIPYPTPYVKQALRTVGIADRSYGYITHDLQGFLSGLIPDVLSARFVP